MPPKNSPAHARTARQEGVVGRNVEPSERSAERSEAVMSDFASWICVSDLVK